MDIPGDLRIAASHEWVRINDDGTVTVGITEYAQGELGDIVYVETPEIDANGELAESPELINDSPYEDGWIFIIKPDDIDEVQQLMDPDDYQAMIENNS